MPRRPGATGAAFACKAAGQVVGANSPRRVRGNGLAFEALPCHWRQSLRPRATDQAGLHRPHDRAATPLACRELAPFVAMAATRNGPPLHEIARRHARDRARHIAVHPAVAVTAPHPRVVHGEVVDTRDIARAGAVNRPVDVARPQRIPGHARATANADAGAADKADHGRCIARPHRHRARHPAPAAAEVGPAPVVRRREAPRRVVDPGPAPRRHPGPVARAVRRPARRHFARKPHGAIAGVLLPVAVVIQRGIAGHVGRYIARGRRRILSGIAGRGPLVEAVGRRIVARACVGQVGARKPHALPATQFDRAGIAIQHGAAMTHRHQRGCAVGRHVDPVVARLARHECQVRRIHLDLLVGRQRPHAQLQRALGQLHLGRAVVKVQDRRGGTAPQPHGRGARVQFRPAARVYPQPVTGRDRPVQAHGRPFVRAGGRKTEAAGHFGHRGDTRGRICHHRGRIAQHVGIARILLDIAGRHAGGAGVVVLCTGVHLDTEGGSQADGGWHEREAMTGLHDRIPDSGGPCRRPWRHAPAATVYRITA